MNIQLHNQPGEQMISFIIQSSFDVTTQVKIEMINHWLVPAASVFILINGQVDHLK